MGKESSQADIRALTREQLSTYCEKIGEAPFRARQIGEWLWKHGATDFEHMTTLSKKLRARLSTDFSLLPLAARHVSESSDGSTKVVYSLHDGHVIEGVLIPVSADVTRMTACVSSQVGCSLRCAFCATARIPFRRSVTAGEIHDQVLDLDRRAREGYGRGLSNIVYMGMGEPLSNYEEVVRSIRLLTGPAGFAIAPRRVTLSTAGLVPQMKALAEEDLGINLAVSLHAATEETRKSMMSSAREYSLKEIASAVEYWRARTGEGVTFEYLLLAGQNDAVADADALVSYARRLPCKINLIEYNPVVGIPFTATDEAAIDEFARRLMAGGLHVTVRHSRGKDIDAACGQLAAHTRKNSAESSTG